jgi:hypothetical protein
MNSGAAIFAGFMVSYAGLALVDAVRALMQTRATVLMHRGLRVQLLRACLMHGRLFRSAPTRPDRYPGFGDFYADL